MTPTVIGVIGLLALFTLIFSRMPVGFVMALIGFVGFGTIVNTNAALSLIAKDIFDVFGSYNLTVIPLFILMGQISFHAGISSRLFEVAYKFIGHWPGGMAIATIGACAGFSAICGSTNATAATMAAVTLPEMRKYHYKDTLAAGVVAAGGSLGILVPPSVVFIIYGIMTEQSIGKLFMAGILPGILLAGLFMLTVVIWAHLSPEVAPRGPRVDLRTRLASLSGLIETLLLFLLVMGGLFLGFFTPTEAGAVGAMGSLLIALFRRNISWKGFVQSLFETTRISCMILVIVAGATIFGHFLAITRIPFDIADWVALLRPARVRRYGIDYPGLSGGGLRHRRPGADHADRADLLSGRHFPGLQPHLVRGHHRPGDPDRGDHPAGGSQRLRGQRGGPGHPPARHLQGRHAAFAGPDRGHPAHAAVPRDCALAAQHDALTAS